MVKIQRFQALSVFKFMGLLPCKEIPESVPLIWVPCPLPQVDFFPQKKYPCDITFFLWSLDSLLKHLKPMSLSYKLI